MSSMVTVEAGRPAGSSGARPPAGRVPAARPVVRDRRGPARPVSVAARGAVLCPSPVAGSRTVRTGLLRRVTAGVGLALASAVAVVGLGLLSDVSAATVSPAPGPVVVHR